jgi:hypothetical protein
MYLNDISYTAFGELFKDEIFALIKRQWMGIDGSN